MRPRLRWLGDAERIDVAVYSAIAGTPTPALDGALLRLTRAADHSRLWLLAATLLAVTRGAPGRRAASLGVASIAGVSAVTNAALKPLARRHRPDLDRLGVPLARQVPMPRSRSLPSGHAASAFAFATGAGHVLPREAAALHAAATLVAYSRVHAGVHFPGDVVAGALIGSVGAQLIAHTVDRRWAN
jgi:undecaprenyl-diphosphatase